MKTANDPRHQRRRHLVEELYKVDFHTQPVGPETATIYGKRETLDTTIVELAPEFPINNINKVDLAILRLAIYEMTIEKETPPHVIIDEAIELAKEYGGETSPGFINGALGKLIKK